MKFYKNDGVVHCGTSAYSIQCGQVISHPIKDKCSQQDFDNNPCPRCKQRIEKTVRYYKEQIKLNLQLIKSGDEEVKRYQKLIEKLTSSDVKPISNNGGVEF
jgi:hypothetical protein